MGVQWRRFHQTLKAKFGWFISIVGFAKWIADWWGRGEIAREWMQHLPHALQFLNERWVVPLTIIVGLGMVFWAALDRGGSFGFDNARWLPETYRNKRIPHEYIVGAAVIFAVALTGVWLHGRNLKKEVLIVPSEQHETTDAVSASVSRPTQPEKLGTSNNLMTKVRRKPQESETKTTDLGIHSPNETVTVPPNSAATFTYGNPSPEDIANLHRMEKEGIEARAHLTKDADKLVLHDLFLTDFSADPNTTSSNRSGFTIRNNDTGVLTHIEYVVVRQLETGNKFLKFYVLYTNETERICKDLADKYDVPLNDFMEGRVETQKTPGDAEAVGSQNLVFSGRIFIYHETYLSPEQTIAVRKAFEAKGLTVILRSTDYVDNQKLKAKVKQLENKN